MKTIFKVDKIVSPGIDMDSRYLLINDDKIEAIYKDGDINIGSNDCEIKDYSGYILTPGLIDTHNHLFTTALQLTFGFDLSPNNQTNFSILLDKIREFSRTSQFSWIVGRGINSDYFTEKRLPNRYILDQADNEKPIFLVHQSGHAAVCNSIAIKLSGLDRATPDPDGGVIERDSNGVPTGILHEKAAMDIVRSNIPPYTKDQYKTALLNAQELYLKDGITCVKDTGGNGAYIDEAQRIEVLNEADYEGNLKMRIAVALPIFTRDEVEGKINLLSKLIPSDHLMSAGFKIFLDGSGVSKTAWMKEDWNINLDRKDIGNKGVIRWDLNQLKEVFDKVSELDCNVSIHAIGDAAVEHILSLIKHEKELGKKASFAIVHSYIPTDQDIQLMKQYNVAVETQPSFIYFLGSQIANNLGRERYERMFPLRSYLNNNINVCISTDAPVSPFNPLYGIYSSINRTLKDNKFKDKIINKNECITFPEAIECYTIKPAHILRNNRIGSLETGRLADFVIWDRSVLHLDPENVEKIHPKAVYISGKKVSGFN